MRNLNEILEGLFDVDVDTEVDGNPFLQIYQGIGRMLDRWNGGNAERPSWISEFQFDKKVTEKCAKYLIKLGPKEGWNKVSNPEFNIGAWYVALCRYKNGGSELFIFKPSYKNRAGYYDSKQFSINDYVNGYGDVLLCCNKIIGGKGAKAFIKGVKLTYYEVPKTFYDEFEKILSKCYYEGS